VALAVFVEKNSANREPFGGELPLILQNAARASRKILEFGLQNKSGPTTIPHHDGARRAVHTRNQYNDPLVA
jgi:hypothetical protein